MSLFDHPDIQKAMTVVIERVFGDLHSIQPRVKADPVSSEDQDSRWRHLQPFPDVEEKAAKYDPELRIKLEMDPDRSLEDQQLEPGSGIMLIKTEEVWATDPTTREPITKMVTNTYARRLTPAEAGTMTAQLYAEGVVHHAMKDYFR